MEKWKDIAGFEGLYQVSDAGRIKSVRFGKEKILKQKNNWKGYCCIVLHKDGKTKSFSVHRLVAKAFIPNPDNLETVNHKNEIKTDNSASNLEWLSMVDNLRYGNGIAKRTASQSKPVEQIDDNGNVISTYSSVSEASRAIGGEPAPISHCCLGQHKTAYGMKWRFKG